MASSSKKAKPNDGASSPIIAIPDHILVEICARLSVRSICRCRYVCKTWYKMLTGTNFSNLYAESARICSLITNGKYGLYKSLHLFEFERDSFFNHRGNLNLDTVFKIPGPVESPSISIVNSCNGFLCLKGRPLRTTPIVIYNPVTGEYSVIPVPDYANNFASVMVHGFGFCPTSKLYKVLLTAAYETCICAWRFSDRPGCGERMTFVYTLGSGVGWRKIENVSCFDCSMMRNSVFLNGALHWLVTAPWRGTTVIMSFDLEAEMFFYLPQPDVYLESFLKPTGQEWHSAGLPRLELGVIRGQLYIIDPTYAPSVEVELWVLKDYGVGNSWTKERLVDVYGFGENGQSWAPGLCQSMDFSNSWDFLYHSEEERTIYFSDENKVMRRLKIGETRAEFATVPYVPSFYPLKDIVAGSDLQVFNVRY